MHIKVTKEIFRMEFRRMGRCDQFSYEALGALYEFLSSYEEDCLDDPAGDELDVIALCCEWEEQTKEEIEDRYLCDMDEIMEYATVIEIGNGRYLINPN